MKPGSILRRVAFVLFVLFDLVVLPTSARAAAPSTPAAAIPPPADLPADVVAPTATEARGLRQTWAVRDGRLWVRPDGPGATWAPLQGTGRPTGKGLEAFVDAPLVAVTADEDGRFAAVGADGTIFHFEGSWNAVWGLPFLPFTQGVVKLPFPVSSLREGRLAYSQRHKAVLWSEDARGQQFFWGSAGTTSLFLLSEDGRRIFLLDPWLPPDTTRELTGPHDGAVTMAALAASASTLFVIGDDGALFTRFEDYDANGGTPFYLYAYDAFPLEGLPGSDPRSETQVHGLPVAPWQRQPDIPLVGRARVSRRIAILQTGQGNAARLLRVVGDNPQGVRGVYEKTLTAPSWTFSPRTITVDDASWLVLAAADPVAGIAAEPAADRSHRAAPPPPRSYAGLVARAGRAVTASTNDFRYHGATFHLDVVDHAVAGGVDVPLVVHTADLWTLFRENNAVDDPLAPRLLKATVTLDDARATPAAQASARALLGPRLGQVFGFVIVADGDELVLAPVDYPFGLDVERRAWVLRSSPSSRRLSPLPLFSRVAAEHIDLAAVTPARCASEEEHRQSARRALNAVIAEQKELASRASFSTMVATTLPLATLTMDAVSIVTTTRWTVRQLRFLQGFEQHLPALAQGPALAYTRRVERSRDDFDTITRRLGDCAQAR
jgi:hypothetical protein